MRRQAPGGLDFRRDRRAHAVCPSIAFITVWSLVVQAPVARWVWGGGWLGQLGALDCAGGTVVHITAGTAALVAR